MRLNTSTWVLVHYSLLHVSINIKGKDVDSCIIVPVCGKKKNARYKIINWNWGSQIWQTGYEPDGMGWTHGERGEIAENS